MRGYYIEHNGHRITSKQQARIVEGLIRKRAYGATAEEVSEALGWHHGTASGPLSKLHKAGIICLLRQRRGAMRVYVLPEYVKGRPTAPYTPNKVNRHAE